MHNQQGARNTKNSASSTRRPWTTTPAVRHRETSGRRRYRCRAKRFHVRGGVQLQLYKSHGQACATQRIKHDIFSCIWWNACTIKSHKHPTTRMCVCVIVCICIRCVCSQLYLVRLTPWAAHKVHAHTPFSNLKSKTKANTTIWPNPIHTISKHACCMLLARAFISATTTVDVRCNRTHTLTELTNECVRSISLRFFTVRTRMSYTTFAWAEQHYRAPYDIRSDLPISDKCWTQVFVRRQFLKPNEFQYFPVTMENIGIHYFVKPEKNCIPISFHRAVIRPYWSS